MLTVVHAQSPRRIERCAELGREPSDGESAFPRSEFLVRVRCKRKKNYRWALIKPCLGAQGSQIRADWRLEPSAAAIVSITLESLSPGKFRMGCFASEVLLVAGNKGNVAVPSE